MWGAHEADGRISAKNAVKIRAALRTSVNAELVYDGYQATQPITTDFPAQDRARARAWVMMNIRLNNEALRLALLRLYAEAWVTGDLVGREEIAIEQEDSKKSLDITKADDIAIIDWSKWNPGDAAAAMLIDPPQAFQNLVNNSGSLIRGLDKTGYDLVGTALADSIRLGYSPRRAAKLINETIGNPARALTIAVTESSRVMNASALNRYKEAGLTKVQWATVLSVAGGGSACEKCAANDGQIVELGASFNSGNSQPPAHPHCRCNLRPVVPDYEDISVDEQGVARINPPAVNEAGVTDTMPKKNDKQLFEDITAEREVIRQQLLSVRQGTLSLREEVVDELNEKLKEITVRWEKAYNKSSASALTEYISFDDLEKISKITKDTREDKMLVALREKLGFNGKPKLVSKEELDNLVDQGWTKTFRGLEDSSEGLKTLTAQDAIEAFKTGEHYGGIGYMGNGTYSSTIYETAFNEYAGKKADNVMTMAIDPKAKIINSKELMLMYKEDVENLVGGVPVIGEVVIDVGRYAVTKGYDVISLFLGDSRITGAPETYQIILNRTVVAVVK